MFLNTAGLGSEYGSSALLLTNNNRFGIDAFAVVMLLMNIVKLKDSDLSATKSY